MRARSFALRDAFPDVLKGLIAVEEALDCPRRAPLPAPTLAAPATSAITPAPTANPRRCYELSTKRGASTLFPTAEEWLAAWARLVRGCKAAHALDKLQAARDTNRATIAVVAGFDPDAAAILNTELDRALAAGPPVASNQGDPTASQTR